MMATLRMSARSFGCSGIDLLWTLGKRPLSSVPGLHFKADRIEVSDNIGDNRNQAEREIADLDPLGFLQHLPAADAPEQSGKKRQGLLPERRHSQQVRQDVVAVHFKKVEWVNV